MDTEPKNPNASEAPENKLSPIVAISNGEISSNVAIADINSLFQDIDAYNQQFSMGSMMSSALMGFLDRAEEINSSEETTVEQVNPLGKVNEEQQHMTASGINVIHQGELKSLGLSLEPVSGKKAMIAYGDQVVGEGEMRLNISERNQFLAFLKGLSPDQVTQTPLEQNLTLLTDSLTNQILDNYDLKQSADEALSFLGSLGTMVDEYKRLGLIAKVEGLEELLNHSKDGNLREFIALKTSGLMQEPGKGFGPADWVKDVSPDGLSQRWGKALLILHVMQDNPKAHEMYKQLLDQLNKCIPLAKNNLSGVEYYTPERRAELAEILNDAQRKLADYQV